MNGCELAITITTLASAIAAQVENDEDLSVLAASITQFGDTLATIAAWRTRCAAEQAKAEQTKQETKEQTDKEPDQKTEQASAEEKTVIQYKKL